VIEQNQKIIINTASISNYYKTHVS
jgi:hypothetical protein